MDFERDILETDILIVGAGPAGLSLAYKLATLASADDSVEMPEILLIDKGSYAGAHCLSGAVMNPMSLAELIPDFKEKGAPLEAEVSSDAMYLLSESGSTKAPFMPPSLKNHGNYVVSLNKLVGWMAEQVEALGVDIYAGLAGRELLVENGRVVGVQTVDMGLDKDGSQRSNFEPGSIIKAKVTVLCEGVHGSLTCQAFEKMPALERDRLPQSYLTGVKEVWEVPKGRIKPGQVIHSVGWPSESRDYGGGWVYGMSDQMVSVGLAVGLDSADPANDPHGKFQQYKNHPLLKSILEGGTMLHYGAKTIPVGGYYSVPDLCANGLMLCGDSAGLLNASKLKGIHLAIKSGALAGETLFEAAKAGDYSFDKIKSYSDKFSNSWVHDELWGSRNFHAAFEGGLYSGLFHAAMQIVTGGRGLFNRRDHKQDHEYMLSRADFKKKYGKDSRELEIKFDNEYTFDKVTDVYKSGTMHEEHQPSHLIIADPDICNNRCTEEYGNPCQYFCPASVYNMVEDEERPGKLKLELTPSNCVHCKTCDIADPYQVITWVTPQGGEGPNFTNC
ncbi:MAG: electron transfer flavoprotein-ubiquinone oxidoreductase [Candidatus Zixiibacteriota bacterium]|nr:MAG: electron transfer flavoprotein-ubiquinone oxidoreductase [candidate division Zixibacteria bacterium]